MIRRHADEIVGLLTRAAPLLDDHGHLHAPAGSPIGGQFIKKALLDALTPSPGGRPRRMTDSEFRARQERVERAITENYDALATERTHRSPDGVWRADRDAIHREIAESLYRDAVKRGVPADGTALVLGGLGGSGKSTVVGQHLGINPEQFVTLNPDEAKVELARRDLVPEIPGHPDLSPMERSALVHVESQRITALLADMAYRDRRNVIWDATMGSESWAKTQVRRLRDEFGYGDVSAVFVDVPVEVSVQRALERYRRGQDEFAAGAGLGGRYVQPSYIEGRRSPRGGTLNREIFDEVRDLFDSWSLFDNSRSGQTPRLLAEGGRKVAARSWRLLRSFSTGWPLAS